MGRLFVIQYDLTPNSQILLCKTCHTHIASFQDLVTTFVNDHSLLLEKAVNVILGPPRDYHSEGRILSFAFIEADVHCVACDMLLGQKILHVNPFHYTLREGRMELKKQKLLFWNGQQIINAVTMFPPWLKDDDFPVKQ